MIDILVSGKSLYIPSDTAITVEQSNACFDYDNITGDIVWTFTIPAKGNAVTLEQVNHVSVAGYRRYRCSILVHGSPVADGYLYVQSVTDGSEIGCGCILNGLGNGFGDRMMRDNDWGADIQISPEGVTLDQHKANFLAFLSASLDERSIYKFFLFTDEKFYSSNEGYGLFKGSRSSLTGETADNVWCHYVNRLFFRYLSGTTPTVDNRPDTEQQGVRIFNTITSDYSNYNGYCFAPAVRLSWVLRRMFEAEGYTLTGDFVADSRIDRLFLQSLNALDGDRSDLEAEQYLRITGVDGADTDLSGNTLLNFDTQLITGTAGKNDVNSFRIHLGKSPTFHFSFNADIDNLERNVPLSGYRDGDTVAVVSRDPFTHSDQVVALVLRTKSAYSQPKFPPYRAVVDSSASSKQYIYGRDRTYNDLHNQGYSAVSGFNRLLFYDNNTVQFVMQNGSTNTTNFLDVWKDVHIIQLTPSTGNSISYANDEVDIRGSYTASALYYNSDKNADWVVELAVVEIRTLKNGVFGGWSGITRRYDLEKNNGDHTHNSIWTTEYGQLEQTILQDILASDTLSASTSLLNVFARVMQWRDHVPSLSNGQFLAQICRFFGLNFYVDNTLHQVQLSFFNDTFAASHVDISEYVTGSERLEYSPEAYSVSFGSTTSQATIPDGYRLDDVPDPSSLPIARHNKQRYVFVADENAYRKSEKSTGINRYEWTQASGSDKTLSVGDADTVNGISVGVSIPSMRRCDTHSSAPKYLPDIALAGCSKLLDDNYSGEFPLILQQYHGKKLIRLSDNAALQASYIEFASPLADPSDPTAVEPTQDRLLDGCINLTPTGAASVGQLFLRRYYTFMSHREPFRFKALLPWRVFLDVYRLMMPQTGSPSAQTRWIMVDNIKYLPEKITYEFGSGDKVLATIECSRERWSTGG